ncbi:gamma-glutamyltransferase [Glaciecola punicea]|nr:gamma-glutamyltransferase [Glaciecola punicea]
MKSTNQYRLIFPFLMTAFFISLAGCNTQNVSSTPPEKQKKQAQQAVAMPDSFAASVAMDVLNNGGNAVDAAIAAHFSLAVTLPEAGNIGGGGFMVIHYEGANDFLDYREVAPQNAHRDMYLNKDGEVNTNQSIYGVLASGVPGSVSGMWALHKKYGSMPWEQLLAPAVALAKDGFVMPKMLADSIAQYIEYLQEQNISVNFADYFASAKAGKLFVQPELAATLSRIQTLGEDGFYKGETALLIEQFMQQHGGLISRSDLVQYESKWRAPIISQWREYKVISAAPPSSGGIAVAQWLQMYDAVKARVPNQTIAHNSPLYVHILAEAGKRVFADRAEYLGDPDFFEVPKTELLAPEYIAKRASSININAISDTSAIRPGLAQSEQTTHFSIVDKHGNAVSNTTTINLGFGSGMVVAGAGFLLNDEMDDFSVKRGVPNFFGAVGGVANEIQPFKRMLSSMTPTIVLKDGNIAMVTGSPGGTTILSSVYLSILNALEFSMPVQSVVDSPRFHHQLLPKDEIWYHEAMPKETMQALEAMGYTSKTSQFGDLHIIVNRGNGLEAASEARGRGKAIVENVD